MYTSIEQNRKYKNRLSHIRSIGFTKFTQVSKYGNYNPLKQTVVEKLDSYRKKYILGLNPILYIKINSKWVIDLQAN